MDVKPPTRSPGTGARIRLLVADRVVVVDALNGTEPVARAAPAYGDGPGNLGPRREAPYGIPLAEPGKLLGRAAEVRRIENALAVGEVVVLSAGPGYGKTVLLHHVGNHFLTGDGRQQRSVLLLSARGRTVEELLVEVFRACYEVPGRRPGAADLRRHLAEVRTLILIDDAAEPDRLAMALAEYAPNSRVVLATDTEPAGPGAFREMAIGAGTPDAAGDIAESEDGQSGPGRIDLGNSGVQRWIELSGLHRSDGVELIGELAGRTLSAVEEEWAGAFAECREGTPRALVQAAAVIRGRAVDAAGELPSAADVRGITNAVVDAGDPGDRRLLRILDSLRPRKWDAVGAAALGETHLTALAQGHGSATALVAAGLVEAETDGYGVVRYRIADGVFLDRATTGTAIDDGMPDAAATAVGPDRGVDASEHASTDALAIGTDRHGSEPAAPWIPAIAQALAAWASRVGPLEAAGEAEAALAVLRGAVALERLPLARSLARAVAPALAATLRWDQWASVLEIGRDAAVRSGAHADAGYFHHELAIRALCLGETDTAAAELAAAIRAYDEAGDARRSGAAQRVAAAAGVPLPDAVLAMPDTRVIAKRYQGRVAVGPGPAKKVTVGTAGAMVLFGVAAVGAMVGAIGGGSGAGGSTAGIGSASATQSPDQSSLVVDPPWYNPLVIPGALPPLVVVTPPPPAPAGAAGQSAATTRTRRIPTVFPPHTFIVPGVPQPSPPNLGPPSSAPPLPGSSVPPPPPPPTSAPSTSISVLPPPPSSSTSPPPPPPPTSPSSIPPPPSTTSTSTSPPPPTSTSSAPPPPPPTTVSTVPPTPTT